MPAFVDVTPGKTPAASVDVQQIIDALSARRNTPLALTVNDPVAYAWTIKNTDAGSRDIIIYAPDGTTVLFSVDGTGVKVSRAGAAAVPPITDIGPTAGSAAAGDHIHGAGGYSATGATTLEALYASATVVTAVNYAVAAGVLFVECTTGVTITLPAAASTNRPITIFSKAGSQTIVAAGGAVHGGSTNTTTGAVMDGVVSAGDAIMYKSDGTNWESLS
jgi:hypothetical protein